MEGQHSVNESQLQKGLRECPDALLPLGNIPPIAGQPGQGIAWVFASYIYTKSFCITEEILKAAERKTGEGAGCCTGNWI